MLECEQSEISDWQLVLPNSRKFWAVQRFFIEYVRTLSYLVENLFLVKFLKLWGLVWIIHDDKFSMNKTNLEFVF